MEIEGIPIPEEAQSQSEVVKAPGEGHPVVGADVNDAMDEEQAIDCHMLHVVEVCKVSLFIKVGGAIVKYFCHET